MTADDPAPKLVAEWRLRIQLRSGDVFVHQYASVAEARAAARRIEIRSKARWTLERRLCGPWQAWSTKITTAGSSDNGQRPAD
jgi:hypothetical protein